MALGRRLGRDLRLGFLVALSIGTSRDIGVRAGESQAAPTPGPAAAYKLAYTRKVDPGKPAVTVQGLLEGPGAGAVRKFSGGLTGKLELRISGTPDERVFDYSVPQVQAAYERVDQPALEKDFFAGFADRLLLVPEAQGIQDCRDVRLRLEFPEAWKVATSLGIESREFTCPSLQDLAGTLICGGDYAVSRFEVAHRDPSKKTTVLVALRGERKIDEARFLSDLKRMIEGPSLHRRQGGHPPGPADQRRDGLPPTASQRQVSSQGTDCLIAVL